MGGDRAGAPVAFLGALDQRARSGFESHRRWRTAPDTPPPPAGVPGLIQRVEELVAAGDLSATAAGPLLSTLEAAGRSLDRGNERAAAGQLRAFVHQVEALVRSRRVDPAVGDALIAAAEVAMP